MSMTLARGALMPSAHSAAFAATAIPAAYAADAKAVVRAWQTKQVKHIARRTNGQGLTAWSPPL